MASEGGTAVSIEQLSLPQLDQLKTQLNEEVGVLADSLQKLKSVQQRLKESKESLEDIKPENEGKPVLVPLTSSMYVPGKLKNTKRVMVDIGTGYFVEKSSKEAEEHFQKKMDYVTQNIEKLQKILLEKGKMRDSVVMVLKMKIMAMQQNSPA